jgi:hypothetical protein
MRSIKSLVVSFAIVTLILGLASDRNFAASTNRTIPLSQIALFSKFAHENVPDEAIDIATFDAQSVDFSSAALAPAATQINGDVNRRPQNETSIAVKPGTSGASATWITGANDYGIGAPIGSGVYTSAGTSYFPPFPLLFGVGGSGSQSLVEVPIAGGDPAVAYGTTRASGSIPAGLSVAYYASLVFSATFCENGVIVQRTFNDGTSWNRPVVPPLAPPTGVGIVAYWDRAQNCSVIHDKEYIAVDNTSGPHKGRVYVSWTRFVFAGPNQFKEAPILLAWSDDNAITFSDPVVVSGASATLCPNPTDSLGQCNIDQFSTPAVLPDGRVAVSFINGNGTGFNQGFRDQYLVTVFNPDTGALTGPFKMADVFDGINDYPIQTTGGQGRSTLCNSNFRFSSTGGLAADAAGTLYFTYSDDKKHAGDFPFPTVVAPRASGYACPAGKATDNDVYVLKSTNGGVTWSDITPATAKGANDQFYPFIAAGAAGRVSVVYYDRSASATNKLATTRVATSATGGSSWTEVVVSDFASNFDNAFFGTGSFIGDYTGIAVDGGGSSHAVWAGVTPGKNDSDVFKATVGP